MRINPKGTLFGHPALKVRNAFKDLPSNGAGMYGSFWWDKHLPDTNGRQRKEIEGRLLRAGFIEQFPHRSRRFAGYQLTARGLRLAGASARLYKRETAKRALAEVIERAKAINAGDYAYDVQCIVVFGSYLSDRQKVGDLDLAVSLVRRPHPGQDWLQFSERFRRRAPSGAHWIDQLTWPEHEVWRFLKGRSHVVSLMILDAHQECVVTSGRHEVVFGDWTPKGIDKVQVMP